MNLRNALPLVLLLFASVVQADPEDPIARYERSLRLATSASGLEAAPIRSRPEADAPLLALAPPEAVFTLLDGSHPRWLRVRFWTQGNYPVEGYLRVSDPPEASTAPPPRARPLASGAQEDSQQEGFTDRLQGAFGAH